MPFFANHFNSRHFTLNFYINFAVSLLHITSKNVHTHHTAYYTVFGINSVWFRNKWLLWSHSDFIQRNSIELTNIWCFFSPENRHTIGFFPENKLYAFIGMMEWSNESKQKRARDSEKKRIKWRNVYTFRAISILPLNIRTHISMLNRFNANEKCWAAKVKINIYAIRSWALDNSMEKNNASERYRIHWSKINHI